MATHVTSMRDGHAFQAWGPWRVAAKAAAKSPDTKSTRTLRYNLLPADAAPIRK